MLNLSAIAKAEKNKIESNNAWLILLEVNIPSEDLTLRLVRNNEDIMWGGVLWQAFPFEVDGFSQNSNGELPSFNVRVSNIDRTVEGYLEQAGGGIGSQVRILVVMSENLDLLTPEMEEEFSVQSVNYDSQWVTFVLTGAVNLFRRIPERRFLKNFCPFKFKGVECQYDGVATECNKSYERCLELNNASRFGGEPAIPQGGIYSNRGTSSGIYSSPREGLGSWDIW